jgi:hypothetical protein
LVSSRPLFLILAIDQLHGSSGSGRLILRLGDLLLFTGFEDLQDRPTWPKIEISGELHVFHHTPP